MLGMQLATEVGVHPDSLMNSLRVAALQGELTAHSLASVASHGTFNQTVEAILEDISDIEDVPLEKLRGWLLRQTTHCPSPGPRATTPSHRMSASPTCAAAFSPRAKSGSPELTQRVSFTSMRRGPSGMNRPSPSPTAAAGLASMGPLAPGGPVLPGGNDEVIRAFGHQELESGNSFRKSGSDTWRTSSNSFSKTQRDSLSTSLPKRKGSGEGRWRAAEKSSGTEKGSADAARW